MNQLLCIVGPTGTGKTARAIEEATKSDSLIVSADSRQVYRGMDIVTGKDHPQNIPIYGIDIVDPDQPCSVSIWYDAVIPHILRAWEEGKQVIVVGGTGLYVKALTQGIPTMSVPIDQSLRDELTPLSITELQTKLAELNQAKFKSLNHSDQNNPRRLIRAIEVAQSPNFLPTDHDLPDVKLLGFKYSNDSNYRSKISDRVLSRLKLGAVAETKKLIKEYGRSLPSMSAIGYKSIISFIENQIDQTTMIESWVKDELAYAKRQLTWFRKQPVIWYDIDSYGN